MASRGILTKRLRYLGYNEMVVFMVVYGPLRWEKKHNSWRTFWCIKIYIPKSLWILGGNFNLIGSPEEKKDGFVHWIMSQPPLMDL